MGANFTEFGDLVLLIGDFYIPQRAVDLPVCFRELLNTDKIRHILCTGNVGSSSVVESLRSISSSLHIVKGDCDGDFDFPEYKVLQFGKTRNAFRRESSWTEIHLALSLCRETSQVAAGPGPRVYWMDLKTAYPG